MTDSDIFFPSSKNKTLLSAEEKDGLKITAITLGDLDRFESNNINKAMRKEKKFLSKDLLTIEFSKNLHKQMFNDVWKWAGKFRTSDKNIGVPFFNVNSDLRNSLEDTKEWIKSTSYPSHELLARFHHRLVFIHPFPNGNGRWGRIYTELLAKKFNMPVPNFGQQFQGEERRQLYWKALQTADQKNFSLLISFLFSK